jgi:hypothetical protein
VVNFKSIQERIGKYAKLLPANSNLDPQANEKKASQFLTAMAEVSEWRHAYAQELIKLLSVQTATFAEELSKGTAKTVTENKLTAESSDVYTTAREQLEEVENNLSYLKSYYEIFQNAHVFYRNLCKEAF